MTFDEVLDEDVSTAVIPAQPGWFLCEPVFAEGVFAEILEFPVVAWTVCTYGKLWKNLEGRSYAIPIIAEEPQPERYAIKTPKGTYSFPDGALDVDKEEITRIFMGWEKS